MSDLKNPPHIHLYDAHSREHFASIRIKSMGDLAVRACKLAVDRGRISGPELLTLLGLEATTEPPLGADKFSQIREEE